MNELNKLNLSEMIQLLKDKKVTSVELTKASLEQIKANSELNNYITICQEQALEQAKIADELLASGKGGVLTGVPIGIKDNISTTGIRTTCASKFLDNYVPVYDASVVTALKDAGAIILGKTNMDEFAMGSGSENSAYGRVKNVHNLAKVTGGSSGGSANTVASFECALSLGSDTGGSIRQPASYCGVVGLKPTYSSVSRFGLVAFASSLDQIGPFTRTVEDSAIAMEVLSFYDKKDSTSSNATREKFTDFSKDVKGLRIGVPKEFFSDSLDADVKKLIMDSVDKLKEQGAIIKEVSLSSFEAALATYYVLSSAEAASNLARFDGIKYGQSDRESGDIIDIYYDSRTKYFGDEVKRRIVMGNYVLSSGYYDAYYLKALKIRNVIRKEFDDALAECDVLVSPTAPSIAFDAGSTSEDKTQVYLSDIYTVPVNIVGVPAISVPCGKISDMPVGIQFIAKVNDEKALFRAGYAIEQLNKA